MVGGGCLAADCQAAGPVPELLHRAPAAMVWAEMAVASRSRNRRAAAGGEQGNGHPGELV